MGGVGSIPVRCTEPARILGVRLRYRIDLSYHGAAFHGWQKQPGLRTAQGEIELWLGRLLGSPDPLPVTGAGRTDAGVHAECMVAHFDTAPIWNPQDIAHRLNAALPEDIAILALREVPDDFHARYSAKRKTYAYRLTLRKSPFERDRRWHVFPPFDLSRATEAGSMILGAHDFSGFCRATSRKENNWCNVTHSEWECDHDAATFRVTADRFLHEMVRLLVGTMVDIARGVRPVALMDEILSRGDVTLCGNAAPPHGLTLIGIEYPDD